MPRDNRSRSSESEPLVGDWKNTLLERIRKGGVTPVISNGVGDDLVLGGHDRLVQHYRNTLMERIRKDDVMPGISNAVSDQLVLDDQVALLMKPASLARIAQLKGIIDKAIADVRALKEDYINFIKNRLFDLAEAHGVGKETLHEVEEQFDEIEFPDFCQRLGYPRLNNADNNPLLILAGLPFPIYVTTCYHHFLETALQQAGKAPRMEICRWHDDLKTIPSVFDRDPTYIPSKTEPLVYHLHGSSAYPDSLVLTEDDHLRFLVAASEGFGSNTDPVHKRVRQAMNESLVVLGYSLSSWDFRSLFWGLIQKRSRKLLSEVTIQLPPNKLEELYLQKYMDAFDFKVYWGEIQGYTQQLYQTLIQNRKTGV